LIGAEGELLGADEHHVRLDGRHRWVVAVEPVRSPSAELADLDTRPTFWQTAEAAEARVATWPQWKQAAAKATLEARPVPEPEPEPSARLSAPVPEPFHPAPWWYRLAARLLPSRVREIPDARDPSRVLLRQVAIIKRRVYLQGFASHEDRRFYHSHGAPLLVIGIWGGYVERRPGDVDTLHEAPYAYTMGADELHAVDAPSPGHTSIAVYAGEPDRMHVPVDGGPAVHWTEHVRRRVVRL
jgi:hypothetical protein